MFEDDCFSYNGLKSYFVRLLCSRASMILDVDYSFVRCIMCLLYFPMKGWFVLVVAWCPLFSSLWFP